MGFQVVDYTSITVCNQPNSRNFGSKFRFGAVLLFGLLVSGCAVSNPGLAGLEDNATLVSKSVAKSAETGGVASADAEVIKRTVAEAKMSTSTTTILAWRNPDTGSSGTIMAIDNFLGKHGQKCRGFKTTVSTFMGIAFYNGEACQISASEWVLSWFRRSENNS